MSMSRAAVLPPPSLEALSIRPWPDDVIDTLGYDPRSDYVETFWLGILGPSTTWLLRRLVAGLEDAPEGFDLPLIETSRRLGLGTGSSRHSPFMRALVRLVQFDVAQVHDGKTVLAVRRRLPPLNQRQVGRLPRALQASHVALQEAAMERPPFEEVRHRARQLALSLFEVGESFDETERQLLRWKVHPALARESTAWAWEVYRARAAARVAGAGGDAA
jgi:hypothetical protein